ncbi:hypothetical protein AB1K32_08685 [Metabacillus dongyingensis]|uniref:hypothetical protein n=1 Tax=Metabacillus dongyingensis TaxID=2874282 RepID=UPI003B8C39EB
MGEKTELKKAVEFFVRGEYYCSRQPASQVHDYDSIKHLAFGTNVDGRTDEFIVYNSNPAHVIDTINKLDIKKTIGLLCFLMKNRLVLMRRDIPSKVQSFL